MTPAGRFPVGVNCNMELLNRSALGISDGCAVKQILESLRSLDQIGAVDPATGLQQAKCVDIAPCGRGGVSTH